MTYRCISGTPDLYDRIRGFILSAQPRAALPWQWMIDRLNFIYAVSCSMNGVTEEEWARRAAIWEDESGTVVSCVLTEGENRGEVFFLSTEKELEKALLEKMFDFAESHCGCKDAEGKLKLNLRIDRRFPLRERIAEERGFRLAQWSEEWSALDLERDLSARLPDGFRLVWGKDATPRLKGRCHQRSFGYEGNEARGEDAIRGFERLRSMSDYRDDLDLMILDPAGSPAAMMGFWYEEENRRGILEPAGTDPDYRRMGLGRYLVAEGVRRLKKMGAEVLWVGSDQPFYLAVGFTVRTAHPVWEKILDDSGLTS